MHPDDDELDEYRGLVDDSRRIGDMIDAEIARTQRERDERDARSQAIFDEIMGRR